MDDETGEITLIRMDSAYELGRALNPRLVEQQLVGGAWMGLSHASRFPERRPTPPGARRAAPAERR